MYLFIMKICFWFKDYHTSKTGNLWYVWFSQNICLIYSIYAKHLWDYKGGIWIRLSELNYIIRMVAGHTIKEMSLILNFNRPFWVHIPQKVACYRWHRGCVYIEIYVPSLKWLCSFLSSRFPLPLDIQVQRCLEGIRPFF